MVVIKTTSEKSRFNEFRRGLKRIFSKFTIVPQQSYVNLPQIDSPEFTVSDIEEKSIHMHYFQKSWFTRVCKRLVAWFG
jgi:hypothetical protein